MNLSKCQQLMKGEANAARHTGPLVHQMVTEQIHRASDLGILVIADFTLNPKCQKLSKKSWNTVEPRSPGFLCRDCQAGDCQIALEILCTNKGAVFRRFKNSGMGSAYFCAMSWTAVCGKQCLSCRVEKNCRRECMPLTSPF